MRRVTDYLTKINNSRLDLIMSCVNFVLQSPNKDELSKSAPVLRFFTEV